MKFSGIILFSLGLLLAPPLAAQNYAPALPDQGTVQYTYNYPGSYIPASWNGLYVGPYEGTLLKVGSDPTHAAISLYCVDFYHYVLPGKVVTADVSTIGGGNGNPVEGVAGPYDDADIYTWDGAGCGRLFDASANGLPESTAISAPSGSTGGAGAHSAASAM